MASWFNLPWVTTHHVYLINITFAWSAMMCSSCVVTTYHVFDTHDGCTPAHRLYWLIEAWVQGAQRRGQCTVGAVDDFGTGTGGGRCLLAHGLEWVLPVRCTQTLAPRALCLTSAHVYIKNTWHLSITQPQPPTQHINLKLYPHYSDNSSVTYTILLV